MLASCSSALRIWVGSLLVVVAALAAASAAAQAPQAVAPDECITDVSATAPGAARTFRCRGGEIDFLMAVPPACTRGGCGLIVDLPGATQSAEAVNTNTGLRQRSRDLARPFVVVNAQRPSGGQPNLFDLAPRGGSSDEIFAFMQRAMRVFAIDPARVHIGGFSQGGIITFQFLCSPEKAAILASASPAASHPRGTLPCFTTAPNFAGFNVPIIYFSGTQDMIDGFPPQVAAGTAIVAAIAPTQMTQVATGPNGFVQTRFTGQKPGQILETLRYDNTNPRLGGHCFVGPLVTPNSGGCNGPNGFEIGAKTLEFYMNNPKANR
jgi:poly(3-hydroxybutyrate) depolymerase